MSDIEILKLPKLANGLSGGRVYYHEGNIFMPLDATSRYPGKIKRAIREFMRDNKDRIIADRGKPGYKNLMELMDEGLH